MFIAECTWQLFLNFLLPFHLYTSIYKNAHKILMETCGFLLKQVILILQEKDANTMLQLYYYKTTFWTSGILAKNQYRS